MHRRAFLAASAAALAAPAVAAAGASRAFRIVRGGDAIGVHTLDAVETGGRFEIAIDIAIAVKILGITAYRYALENREIWQDGHLVSVRSRVDDDGSAAFATVARTGDALTVEGSGYAGPAPIAAVTTSYYAPAFLTRAPWLSTQSGKPLDVVIAPDGRDGWHRVTGELETTLGYDARGEWTGCEFDAGGTPAFYEVTRQRGEIGALWRSA